MDKLKTDTLSPRCRSLVRELTDRQAFETFLTLPEYNGDVSRVLTCSLTPLVNSVTVADDGVTLEGSCQIRVLYLGQDGGLYAPEANEPFSFRLASSDCAGCRAVDFVWEEDCTARAVSPRKLEVHAALHMVVKCYRGEELHLLSNAQGAGIQLKSETTPLLLTDDRISKKLTLTETLTLPAECADARRILSSRAQAMLSDTKTAGSKMLLSGEATLTLLYLPEGNDLPQTAHMKLSFHETVDLEDLPEDGEKSARLRVEGVSVSLSGSGGRSVNCAIRLRADITCGKTEPVRLVVDAFSTRYEPEAAYVSLLSPKRERQIAETIPVVGEWALSELSVEGVVDHCCRTEGVKIGSADGKLTVSGRVVFDALLRAQDGSCYGVKRELDFSWEEDAGEGELRFSPELTVAASSVNLSGGKLCGKAELFLSGTLRSLVRVQAIASLTCDEKNQKAPAQAGLCVYFAKKGESLWQIAKDHNAPPEVLAADNQLEDDALSADQTLLIARV